MKSAIFIPFTMSRKHSKKVSSPKVEGTASKYLVADDKSPSLHDESTARSSAESKRSVRRENANFLSVVEEGTSTTKKWETGKKRSTGAKRTLCHLDSEPGSETSDGGIAPPTAVKTREQSFPQNRRAREQRRSGMCDTTDPHLKGRQTLARVFKKRF